MGQALDKDGNILGEAFGNTRQEVFDKLVDKHADALELRIRTFTDRNEDLKKRLRDYSMSGEQIFIDALKRIEDLEKLVG